jgi:outer membrane lipoprotein SlyB
VFNGAEERRVSAINVKTIFPAAALCVALSACGTTPRDRVVSGGLIGAATGATVGLVTTGDATGTVLGAALGGLGGGIIGYATAPHRCQAVDKYGYTHRVRC